VGAVLILGASLTILNHKVRREQRANEAKSSANG